MFHPTPGTPPHPTPPYTTLHHTTPHHTTPHHTTPQHMHTFCTIYTVSAIYAFMTSLSFAKVISIIPCLFKISVHFLCFSVFIACRDVMYVTSSAFGENLARHKTSIKNRQQNHWISHSPFRPVTEDLVTLCTFYVALGHWAFQAVKPCWN